MKKDLLKIKGVTEISKRDQKLVAGGSTTAICPAGGCYRDYFGGGDDGSTCVVYLGPFSDCCGTVYGNKCCLPPYF